MIHYTLENILGVMTQYKEMTPMELLVECQARYQLSVDDFVQAVKELEAAHLITVGTIAVSSRMMPLYVISPIRERRK